MSAPNFTPIQLFRTSTASAIPSAGSLADGELAINLTDERLYFKNAAGVVKLLASNTGALGTVTSVAASGGTTGLTFSGSPITTSGTLTLGGTLAVANGGTGVTTSTGTGSVVLSNSPTLVTPTLGVASATSIATGKGTVGAVAYGFTTNTNTGMWSPSSDAIAFSTAGSERLRVDSSGNVGIGASPAPNTRLYVRTATTTDTAYYADNGVNSGFIVKFASNTTLIGNDFGAPLALLTNNAERMRITAAGDVGIGTSAVNLASGRGVQINAPAGQDTRLKLTNVDSGTGAFDGFDLGVAVNGAVNLIGWEAAPMSFFTSGTERMRITAAGNVGIGTTAPVDNITVFGSAPSIGISGGLGSTPSPAYTNLAFRGFADRRTALIRSFDQSNSTAPGGGLEFLVNANMAADTLTSAMRIDASGNVGIGTSSPTAKLDVNNGANTDMRLTTSGSGYLQVGQFSNGAFIGTSSSDPTAGVLRLGTGLTERMRIDASGNVGIGTSSPGARLHASVGSSGNTLPTNMQGIFESFGNNGIAVSAPASDTGGLYFPRSTVAYYAGVERVNTALVFRNNDAERMRIDSSGNVGIGTSSPEANGRLTLDRAGSNYLMLRSGGTNRMSLYVDSGISVVDAQANPLALNAGSAERMRITAAGDVGIGTTSPAEALEISRDANPKIRFLDVGNIDARIGIVGSTALGFEVNGAERMRIDSSGNLLVGTTTSSGRLTVDGNAGGVNSVYVIQSTAGGFSYSSDAANNGGIFYHMQFRQAGVPVGSITSSGSTTAYNTASDYRLKDIDGPIANSGAYIDALKPVQGSWKADGSRFIGLLAHEAQEVSETPIATGEKDGEEMQAMDYSAPEIIANLIAEIQSLRARVAQLEGN